MELIIDFIKRERFYRVEHINASELHVVRAAYFPSAMAAREGRQGECKGRLEGWWRIVTAAEEGARERSMSCSLYLRRSHVISAVIGLGYRYVCIMPR